MPNQQTDFDHTPPVEESRRSLSFETSRDQGVRMVLKVGMPHAEQVRLTILEMLDVLEAALTNKRSLPATTLNRSIADRGTKPSTLTPIDLRIEIKAAGLDQDQFAATFGIEGETLEAWLHGTATIPDWFERSLALYDLLTPAAKRKVLNRPAKASVESPLFDEPARKEPEPVRRPAQPSPPARLHPMLQDVASPATRTRPARKTTHPFSRIDEL